GRRLGRRGAKGIVERNDAGGARAALPAAPVLEETADFLGILTAPVPSGGLVRRERRLAAETDEDAFFRTRKRTPEALMDLLCAQAARGLAVLADRTLSGMESRGPPPDVAAYTTVMAACARAGD